MRSSHGDVAVSNTDDRRFDSFRACAHRTTSPGTSSLTTAEASSPGIASRRSREWVGRVIASSTDRTCVSRLTGRAPGSYPGTDWVRVPGRVPSRRSSASRSAGPSSRRSRVRVPSVARSSTWPNGEGAGLRIRRMQVRPLPSTPPRRSSAEQSAALRRRRPHVRIVPARLSLSPALVAQEREHVPGTDEVVGATPTEGPKEGIRPDEEPVCYAGTGRQPVWVRVPPLPLVEAIRLDEEPVPKTGRGREALGRSSRPASSTRRDGREVKTPGPQPGERGSSRHAADGRACQRPSGSTPDRPKRVLDSGTRAESTMPGRDEAKLCSESGQRHDHARTRERQRAGERDSGAESTCQVVERDVRLLPGRRGFEPLPGSATLGGRGFRRVAANRETRVRFPPGRPSQHQVVVVQRRGCRCATPAMRVRVPPTTPTTFRRNTEQERGRACPPTSTTSSSPGRARSTSRPSARHEKTARLPIIEGHVALMPDAHVGKGATIGSVIPTTGAVIPSAVGVDIGCGMIAAELDVTEDQLPDALEPLLGRIERAIPAGVGRGHDRVAAAMRTVGSLRIARRTELSDDQVQRAAKQFGTLGSGNHFFELCVDERTVCGWCCTRAAVASATSSPRCTSPRHATSPRHSSCGSRTRTSRTSPRARRSSRRTSPTCSGHRSTHGRTVTR